MKEKIIGFFSFIYKWQIILYMILYIYITYFFIFKWHILWYIGMITSNNEFFWMLFLLANLILSLWFIYFLHNLLTIIYTIKDINMNRSLDNYSWLLSIIAIIIILLSSWYIILFWWENNKMFYIDFFITWLYVIIYIWIYYKYKIQINNRWDNYIENTKSVEKILEKEPMDIINVDYEENNIDNTTSDNDEEDEFDINNMKYNWIQLEQYNFEEDLENEKYRDVLLAKLTK